MDIEKAAWVAEGQEIALAVFVDAFRIIKKRPPEDPAYRDALGFLWDDSHYLHQLLGLERPFLEGLLERVLVAKEEREAEPVSS